MSEMAGIKFTVNPSPPTKSQPGQVVTASWRVDANQPGKKMVITMLDEYGTEVDKYVESLVGQLSPFVGSWGLVVPPGVLDAYWHVKCEFFADDPAMGDDPSMYSTSQIGVAPGEITGALRVRSNITVYKRYGGA